MSEIEEVKKILNDLRKKARHDSNLSDVLHTELVTASAGLEKALEKLEQSKQLDATQIKSLYENAQRLSLMLEDIKRGRSTYPSYIDEFVPSIADAPYTMPRNLFEPQGAQQITINVGNQLKMERAELVLSILFPGSTTFRYGTSPFKIRLGRWSQDGRAHLSSIHELSPKPEFELKVRDTTLHVYKPLKLNAFHLRQHNAICVTCLSLIDDDETCGHGTLQPHSKLPSNFPVIKKIELARKSADSKTLQKPLSLIVPQATFLPQIEVGLAVTGFERTATVRGHYRTMRIEYDPPIGIRLSTSGLSFRINIPEDFLSKTLASSPMIRRDLIIQILANVIAEIMGEVGLPSYYHELLLSSIISTVHLDDIINEKATIDRLRAADFIAQATAEIDNELRFYESSRPDAELVSEVYKALQTFDITEKNLCDKLRENILHSMAHVLLLATAVTSGSQLDDLDYLLKDVNEVVIFDAVSGGNGSSETAFEFLFEIGKFDIAEYLESEERQEIYKPRNLDETAFELMLPCLNGVADRAFLFGKINPPENEIRRKLVELCNKSSTHAAAIARIKKYGSQSIFSLGIGYHGVDYSQLPREADRFKEVVSICLHGCPECISIGRKCHVGSFYEKYSISKLALDELLNYVLIDATFDSLSEDQILKILKGRGLVVIRVSCDQEKSCEEISKNVNSQILGFSGREIDGGHIKFAGHWMNVDLPSGAINYYYMLKVM